MYYSTAKGSKKPAKPRPDFPLFPHATGRWAKKIRGNLHYFGKWADPDAALQRYVEERDDLYAGRKPRRKGDGLTIPVLSFYRSQRENQSWIGALTAILDTSALLIAGVDGRDGYQARLTFAMARHAAVDLAMVFQTPPLPPEPNRLSDVKLARLRESLSEAGITMRDEASMATALEELRRLYEPFVNALATFFQFALPPFQPEEPPVDNWQTSPWLPRSPGLGSLPAVDVKGDHFD